MPYNPQVTYNPGYYYQGISGAADDLAKGFEQAYQRYDEHKKATRKSDAMMTELNNQIDPTTGEPVVSDDMFNRYRQAKDRVQYAIGVSEASKLSEAMQRYKGVAGEQQRDTDAYNNPVSYVQDPNDPTKKIMVSRNPRGGVTNIDPDRTNTNSIQNQNRIAANQAYNQADKEEKMRTTAFNNSTKLNYPGATMDMFTNDKNPFGVLDPKTKQFTPTPQEKDSEGNPLPPDQVKNQTHVELPNKARVPLDQYNSIRSNIQRIQQLRQKKQDISDNFYKPQQPTAKPYPGVPVAMTDAESYRFPADVTYQRPDGKGGWQLMKTPPASTTSQPSVQPVQPVVPYQPGVSPVLKPGLVPSPGDEE